MRGRREGTRRVLRGGSWNNTRNNVRTANRNRNDESNVNNGDTSVAFGFRCVRSMFCTACRSGVTPGPNLDHHGDGEPLPEKMERRQSLAERENPFSPGKYGIALPPRS